MMQCPISSASSSDTSWSDENASENRDVHNVEKCVHCSFAHHACSPLLQGGLQEEELCEVAFDVSLCSGCDLSLSKLNSGAFMSRTWQCSGCSSSHDGGNDDG